MKRYVNCYRGGNGLAPGTVYSTEAEARGAALPDAYAVAVEIEMPDPPAHEWKTGDWFVCDRWPGYCLIVAPYGPGTFWVVVFRYSDRALLEAEAEPDYLNAVPCDPPAWFTGEGAS